MTAHNYKMYSSTPTFDDSDAAAVIEKKMKKYLSLIENNK